MGQWHRLGWVQPFSILSAPYKQKKLCQISLLHYSTGLTLYVKPVEETILYPDLSRLNLTTKSSMQYKLKQELNLTCSYPIYLIAAHCCYSCQTQKQAPVLIHGKWSCVEAMCGSKYSTARGYYHCCLLSIPLHRITEWQPPGLKIQDNLDYSDIFFFLLSW